MKKNEFIRILSKLVAIKKDEDNLQKAFERFEPNTDCICFGRYETLVVETLKIAMEDKDGWIDYWLWELYCGTEAKEDSVTANGKNIPIKTMDNLYDLIKNSPRRKSVRFLNKEIEVEKYHKDLKEFISILKNLIK